MWTITEFDEVVSTNTLAAEMLARGEAHHGDVIVARHQTAGRGRTSGRVWADAPGASLLMSVVLTNIPEPTHLLQYRVARAVLIALREIAGNKNIPPDSLRLKWPNDILIGHKKVCGILLEAQWNGVRMHSAIAGIGVNVQQRSFPEELRSTATSLVLEGIDVPVVSLREGVLRSLERELTDDSLRSTLVKIRQEFQWMHDIPSLDLLAEDRITSGLHFVTLDDSGALRLRDDSGTEILVRNGSLSWNKSNR